MKRTCDAGTTNTLCAGNCDLILCSPSRYDENNLIAQRTTRRLQSEDMWKDVVIVLKMSDYGETVWEQARSDEWQA